MPIIEAEDLTKEFHRRSPVDGPFGTVRALFSRRREIRRAVNGISFTLEAGELVGYLGPNGAGKSTSVKMLTGILRPSSGHLEVAGLVPWRDRERNARNIGVVFGQRTQLWWDLPLRDSLELVGSLYGVERTLHLRNMERFTELLDMGSFLDTPVRQLSLGQRMRGDLAAAMLPAPRVLFLDEPTIGLDVVAKQRIREFIGRLNREEGTTVVLTTHDLDDVEHLCRRILLIDGGRVVYDGDVQRLKAHYAPHRQLIVQLAPGVGWHGVALGGVTEQPPEPSDPGRILLRCDAARTPMAEVIRAVLARHTVTDLSIVEPELEGVIHRIYSDRKAL